MFKISNYSASLEDKKILHSITLQLQEGKIYGLMGPNGSGKSSLAMSLLGHPSYQVMCDEYSLLGKSFKDLRVDERSRHGLFVAFQYPQSIPGILVFDFLKEAFRELSSEKFEIKQFEERAIETLEQVGLDRSFLYRSLNDGFSGGEKKRFEIAQLLLFKPKLAILDEIDSGLDVDGMQQIAQALMRAQEENPSMSLLIITHYQRIFEFLIPDEIHILIDGKLVCTGDYELGRAVEKKGYHAYR